MARIAAPLQVQAHPAGDARRSAALDAVGLALLRTLPASFSARLCRGRDQVGAGASTEVLRERARCTACGRRGAALQHPSWAGEQTGFEPFPERLPSV